MSRRRTPARIRQKDPLRIGLGNYSSEINSLNSQFLSKIQGFFEHRGRIKRPKIEGMKSRTSVYIPHNMKLKLGTDFLDDPIFILAHEYGHHMHKLVNPIAYSNSHENRSPLLELVAIYTQILCCELEFSGSKQPIKNLQERIQAQVDRVPITIQPRDTKAVAYRRNYAGPRKAAQYCVDNHGSELLPKIARTHPASIDKLLEEIGYEGELITT